MRCKYPRAGRGARVYQAIVIGLGATALFGLGACCEVLSYGTFEPCPPPRCGPPVVVVQRAPCPPPRIVEYRYWGPGHW
jgi:hypothetical protein